MELVLRIALGVVMAAGSLQVQWHDSTAVGTYSAGRLEQGVHLPSGGRAFFTWDPVLRRSPNRGWRRWGTDRLVRVVLSVARGFHAAHPRAVRMAVGDLSRPHGGDFGPRFGYIGHASHQNGLDVIVRSYPGALFLSAGGYHHHVGLNTWQSQGAPPPPEGALGLDRYELVLPDQTAVDAAAEALGERGNPERVDDGVLATDPSGNHVLLTARG